MMHTTIVDFLLFGGVDSPRPWSQEEKVTFICPVPGYDRHFSMLAEFGIEMVTVDMHDDGPDMAAVEALVKDDPSVKGIWIVPTYANPSGAIVSQEKAARLAAMPTAAPDFTIFWDNAYAFHHLTEVEAKSADILSLAAASGHPNRPIMFASTSKITFAGAGVAVLAASQATVTWWLGHLAMGSIGPDKVNHLRHVEFFGDAEGVRAHMRRHRDDHRAEVRRGRRGPDRRARRASSVAEWTHPTGGYFVNLDVLDGTASRVVALAKGGRHRPHAGGRRPSPAARTPATATSASRPTFPALDEVRTAMAGVATCVALAAAEKLTQDRGRRGRYGERDARRADAPTPPKEPRDERHRAQREHLRRPDDLQRRRRGPAPAGGHPRSSDDLEDVLDRGYSPPDDRARARTPSARPPTRSPSTRRSTSASSRRSPTRTPPTARPTTRAASTTMTASAATTPTRSMPRTTGSATTRWATERAGRLVADDEGAHEDDEKQAWASDVGIDGAGASAEEAAMHIVDEIAANRRPLTRE